MSEWLGGAVSRAESVSDSLSPKRAASLALLREQPWPTRRTEAWMYTPLAAIERGGFAPVANRQSVTTDSIAGLDSIDLVFVGGQLQGQVAKDLPEGLEIVSLSEVSSSRQGWALETFASIKPQGHLFGLVNDVLATSGVVIDVAAGTVIDRPIRIVNIMSDGQEAHTRVLMRLAADARATVIEQYNGTDCSLNTGFAEYAVGPGAELEHYRFTLQSADALSLGGSHFELAERAQLNSTVVGFGSRLSRLDMDIHHAGEFAHAKLNAIYLLDGDELFDLHTTVEHAVANGRTEENVRGIVAGSARAVFNGRIHIHRDAQKTLAELNNRNLLMSADAEINTKPELEIYADDVRCAHGATVAEIDKQALYYMQSRGVSKAQAKVMLSFGFINELVEQMPSPALAEWLRPQLNRRFSGFVEQ